MISTQQPSQKVRYVPTVVLFLPLVVSSETNYSQKVIGRPRRDRAGRSTSGLARGLGRDRARLEAAPDRARLEAGRRDAGGARGRAPQPPLVTAPGRATAASAGCCGRSSWWVRSDRHPEDSKSGRAGGLWACRGVDPGISPRRRTCPHQAAASDRCERFQVYAVFAASSKAPLMALSTAVSARVC